MAFDPNRQPELHDAEAHVRRILDGRRKANASGQRGEDVEHIRAAYDAANAAVPVVSHG